jgi:hypothetical protein
MKTLDYFDALDKFRYCPPGSNLYVNGEPVNHVNAYNWIKMFSSPAKAWENYLKMFCTVNAVSEENLTFAIGEKNA